MKASDVADAALALFDGDTLSAKSQMLYFRRRSCEAKVQDLETPLQRPAIAARTTILRAVETIFFFFFFFFFSENTISNVSRDCGGTTILRAVETIFPPILISPESGATSPARFVAAVRDVDQRETELGMPLLALRGDRRLGPGLAELDCARADFLVRFHAGLRHAQPRRSAGNRHAHNRAQPGQGASRRSPLSARRGGRSGINAGPTVPKNLYRGGTCDQYAASPLARRVEPK